MSDESQHNESVENTRSPVAGNASRELTLGTKIGIMVLIGVIAIAFIWFNSATGRDKKNADQQNTQSAYDGSGNSYVSPPTTLARPRPKPIDLPLPDTTPRYPIFTDNSTQDNPASAPIFAYDGQNGQMVQQAEQASDRQVGFSSDQSPTGASESGFGSGSDNKSALTQRLSQPQFDAEQAKVLANPNMTITEGTVIPCTLQTAINSELPGLVTCIVPIDIRGTNGNIVLLDRGTKIVGQINSGLMQGENRVFVDWTRAETPEGVIITLDSPGVDQLGRSGLPGAVNNHFWQRFGGALMLTLVQGGLNAAVVSAAGNNDSNSNSSQAALGFMYSAQQNGQTIANTALQNTINIAPTLTKNQGETVGLIVAHDLDFSGVYNLSVSAPADISNGD